MKHMSYRKKVRIISDDEILDATEYAATAVGMTGIDITPLSIMLSVTQAARLTFTPNEVKKPKNESAKLVAFGASVLLSAFTGNRCASSTFEFIARGIID